MISTENPEKKLLPGMTANIACEVDRRTATLKVPNAALRFKPEANGTKPPAGVAAESRHGKATQRVWIQKTPDAPPTEVAIVPGIGDGSFTELKDAGSLKEGDAIIVGLADLNSKASTETVNPFAPPPPPGARRR